MVVLCHSQQQAAQVKAQLAEWLAPRGLAFNEDKTKVVRLDEGFDFLGFNVRRYPNRKLLVKPSQAALRRVRERVSGDATAAPTWSGSPGRLSNRGFHINGFMRDPGRQRAGATRREHQFSRPSVCAL